MARISDYENVSDTNFGDLSVENLFEVVKIQTEVVQQGLDLSGVMFLVALRAQQLSEASGAVVEISEEDEMVYRAASGITEKMLGLRIKAEGSLSGLCLKLGYPLICDNVDTDDRVDKAACAKVGLKSMIVVPLKHDDTSVGVLKVVSQEINAFEKVDIRILELMSDLIAAAMFNAAKYESDELFKRATFDTLTGVANRALFYDRLRQRCNQAKRANENFGIMSIDMDDFKQINDSFGHRTGDAALKETANRIQKAVRESDTVARLGGDEFGIILYKTKNYEEGAQLITRIMDFVNAPFKFENYDVKLRISIGFAMFDEQTSDIEQLMDKADQEMYTCKASRRHQIK